MKKCFKLQVINYLPIDRLARTEKDVIMTILYKLNVFCSSMKKMLVIILLAPLVLRAQSPNVIKEVPICYPPTVLLLPECFEIKGNEVYIASDWYITDEEGGIQLTKADTLGNIISSDTVNGSCYEQMSFNANMVRIGNNLFFCSYSNSYDGAIENFHGPYDCNTPTGAPYYDFMLTKATTAGNIKWAKCYGGQNPDSPCKVIESKDGDNIILAGTVIISGVGDYMNPLSSINEDDIWLAEIDTADGSIIREKCFGTSIAGEYLYDIIPTHDKGYLLAAVTNYYPNNFLDPVLIKVDSLWNQQWMTILPTPHMERGMLIMEDSISGDIYWLINSNETDSIFNTTYYNTQEAWWDNFNNWLIKLNKYGDTTWVKFVGTPYSENIYQETFFGHNTSSMIFNFNHEIVTLTSTLKVYNGQDGTFDMRFMKLDTAGTILTEKIFSEYTMLNSIKPLSNDRYLCLAQRQFISNSICTYMLVTLGNTVGIEEDEANNIKIYPNPATDIFTINSGSLQNIQVELFDISGRKLFQQKVIANQENIDVSSLANGVYICTIISNNKIVKREKVIVSR